jgi:hypothetical protein
MLRGGDAIGRHALVDFGLSDSSALRIFALAGMEMARFWSVPQSRQPPLNSWLNKQRSKEQPGGSSDQKAK